MSEEAILFGWMLFLLTLLIFAAFYASWSSDKTPTPGEKVHVLREGTLYDGVYVSMVGPLLCAVADQTGQVWVLNRDDVFIDWRDASAAARARSGACK